MKKHINNYIDYNQFWNDNFQNTPEFKRIEQFLEIYKMHGKLIGYDLLSNNKDHQSGFYYICSLDPITDDMNPYELSIYNKEYKHQLFFPYEFAIDLQNSDPITIFTAIYDFIEDAYALKQAFEHEHKDVPLVIDRVDLNTIKDDMKILYDPNLPANEKYKFKNQIKEIVDKYDKYLPMEKHSYEEISRCNATVSCYEVLQDLVPLFRKKLLAERYFEFYIDETPIKNGIDYNEYFQEKYKWFNPQTCYNAWDAYSDGGTYCKIYYRTEQESIFMKVFNDIIYQKSFTKEELENNQILQQQILQNHNYEIREIPADYINKFIKSANNNNLTFAFITSERLDNKSEHFNIIYDKSQETEFAATIQEIITKTYVLPEIDRYEQYVNNIPKKTNSKFKLKFWER